MTSAIYAHAVRRVPVRLLGTLGAFYRTGHAEHQSAHEPAPLARPLDGQTRALTAARRLGGWRIFWCGSTVR